MYFFASLCSPAAKFFLSNLCRVEIARDDELHRVLFPRPLLVRGLMRASSTTLAWTVTRSSTPSAHWLTRATVVLCWYVAEHRLTT